MKKVIMQMAVILVLFYATWYILGKIDWITVFKVEQITKSTEKKLGKLYWQFFSRTENEIQSPEIINPIDTLLDHICESNSIDRSKIKLHILKKNDINAFSLPDNYLVIYSGLIDFSKNEAELCGVMCHEISHMEKNHVMKKLIKEMGLSVLISMSTGNGGGETIKQTAKLLTSSAYDRTLEREADITAVDCLLKAQIDPEPFADFMLRLSDKEKNLPNQLDWISTHPNSKERADYITKYINKKTIINKQILTSEQWNNLKNKLKE